MSRYQTAVQQVVCGPLQLFPGGFLIEISPDVFLKGMVGKGGDLFSVEHRRYFLYPHPKGVPYPSMP